ncbi:MAG: hypothetical protein RR382_00285 [Tannerellaceae bacterium]
MLRTEEIAEERDVTDMEVMTPTGWCKVTKVYKTIPLDTWILSTTYRSIVCSKEHLVRVIGGYVIPVRELTAGSIVEVECPDQFSGGTAYEMVLQSHATGEKEVLYDITIANKDGIYYSNGIASHNSTTYAADLIMSSFLIPKLQSLYITPYPEQLETFAKRLQEVEASFRYPLGKQNVYSKRFDNGSLVRLLYILTTPQKARGITASKIVIDEAQNMDGGLLYEVLQALSMARMPSTTYAGTALTVDTLLEAKWQESSKASWMVKSPDDKTWIDMHDADTLFKVCGGKGGPICPVTGRRLDVTNGLYVHSDKACMEDLHMGFHVPQMIIPDMALDPTRWAKIYNEVKRNPINKIKQENFGIAVEEGAREITLSNLKDIASINWDTETLRQRTVNGYYKWVVSGCDWGGSDYNPAEKTKLSYTVHCIIGGTSHGDVDILHWRRYAGMDYEEIVDNIIEDHNYWHAGYIASDYGVGLAYNMRIRKSVDAHRHFIFKYSGPDSHPISVPKDSHFFNMYSLNRTESISAVYTAIGDKEHKLHTRMWDDVQTYMLDFLNMYRIPTESSGGRTMFVYRKHGAKADDSLHAFNFGYSMLRVLRGEALVEDPSVQRIIDDLLRGTYDGAIQGGQAEEDDGERYQELYEEVFGEDY